MKIARVLTPAILAIFVLALAAPAALAQSAKVGVFDPQRVSEETNEGKTVQSQLSQLRDAKQKQIGDKQSKIEELQGQLQQQALSLSADRRTSLEMDIQRRMLDLENARELAGRELQLEIAAAQNQFNERLLRAVESYAAEQSFDLILDTSVVAYMSKAVDCTTGIIDKFNALPPAN